MVNYFRSKNRLKIQIQSRYMSDPPHSDIDFKNKMDFVWTILKNLVEKTIRPLFIDCPPNPEHALVPF